MTGAIIRRFFEVAVFLLVLAASLFISAGRWDWTTAWALVGLYAIDIIVNAAILIRTSPDLIAERAGIGYGAKAWDRVLGPLAGFWGPLATWIVAGMDVRFQWSPHAPGAIEILELVTTALGLVLLSWAMISNRFFSGVARIQRERGHTVVSSGPYQYVRHPGYTGMIIVALTTPLLLGSIWALIPGSVTVAITVARTVLEDGMLHEELDGYIAYAQRVQYRLAPGIW